MMQTSIMTQKGQVTIPYFIRQKLAIKPGTRISFLLDKETIKLSPMLSFFEFRGSIKSKKVFDIKKMREEAKKNLSHSYGKSP